MQDRIKQKTKVTLEIDTTLAAAAAAKGVDLANLVEQALVATLRTERKQKLSEEDRSAIEAQDRYVAEHGAWNVDRRTR